MSPILVVHWGLYLAPVPPPKMGPEFRVRSSGLKLWCGVQGLVFRAKGSK